MQPKGLIDLSEARLRRETTAPVEQVVTTADLLECLSLWRFTMREALDMRFGIMVSLPSLAESKIIPPPGQPTAIQEAQLRLRFLDASLQRLSDMIGAVLTVNAVDEGTFDLTDFPAAREHLSAVKKTLFNIRDKQVNDISQADMLLVAGFADMQRWLKFLK